MAWPAIPRTFGPGDARHGDDQIRAQVTSRRTQQRSILIPDLGPGVHGDLRVRQHFGDRVAGLVAEGGQRPQSRLAHDDLWPWAVGFGGLRSGEQRQFVDR